MATHDFKINLPDVYRYYYVLFFFLEKHKTKLQWNSIKNDTQTGIKPSFK